MSGARTQRTPTRRRPLRKQTRTQRWRIVATLIAFAMIGGFGGIIFLSPTVKQAVDQVQLPLRHADIIRRQARAKRLDPALVAALIYTESRFRDQTSGAGARGLMQILPTTADFIARRSGGTAFESTDLARPQINIAYGSYYLRYLLDRYDGNLSLALAAYNAGETNLNRWLAHSRERGQSLAVADIPFAETRNYVRRVLALQRQYRAKYPQQLLR